MERGRYTGRERRRRIAARLLLVLLGHRPGPPRERGGDPLRPQWGGGVMERGRYTGRERRRRIAARLLLVLLASAVVVLALTTTAHGALL